MAVQTDDGPADTRRSCIALMIFGLVLGIVSSAGAFLFTYEGYGPGPDDPDGRAAVTGLVFLGAVIAIVSIVSGALTYWSESAPSR
jgi:hypothetical protein